jgi:hypothetical protein
MAVYAEVHRFYLIHRACGTLRAQVDPETQAGYQLTLICSCGASFRRWVTPTDAEADLLHSALLAFDN